MRHSFIYIGLMALISASLFTAQAQPQRISLDSQSGHIRWTLGPLDEPDAPQIPAVVPGTAFGAYVEAGLEPDPNWGDNAYKVDKAKYDRDFLYTGLFTTPARAQGERLWLNFQGVNRKGEVRLNGRYLGLLDGFMDRGRFDITAYTRPGEENRLEVKVVWPGLPVPNHASPTYISSAGWDWMPYVPGLLAGITDEVWLSTSRDLLIRDPWVRTMELAENEAQLSLEVTVENAGRTEQKAQLLGCIQPGNIRFTREITLPAGRQKTFRWDAKQLKALLLKEPRLWWPNGYGEPHLYTLDLQVEAQGQVSDLQQVTFGVRKYAYEFVDGVFRLRINGQPIFCKGGNWGMSEWMLRARGEEYDLKLQLHKEMHFNMIRNWIGSTTDEAFYEACDRHGIMVWDDFWLNSHPNLPDDVEAFQHNAIEKIKRLRNHACVAVWCGDNEGYPVEPLNSWLRADVAHFDGGDRWYQANSNSDGLSGSGAWTNGTAAWYFTPYPISWGQNMKRGWGFRTEVGTAVFTTFQSFKKFMPEEDWWPRNEMWNKHFFGKSAANASPDKYFNTVEENYGKATGIEDFCRKAQLVNIEVNKALFEGWQHHLWNDATGVLTWMSQSAYPSFVWQTYDYYYDLTGAYWGARKACEPLHIQWSAADNSVKVVNTTLQDRPGLKAKATIYDLQGRPLSTYSKEGRVDAKANEANYAFHLQFLAGNLAFMKPATASTVSQDAGAPALVTDGSDGSRWASEYRNNQWICVDLEKAQTVGNVVLKWEGAHAKSYKLQLSQDGQNWQDVAHVTDCKGGVDSLRFAPTQARYVRVYGLERATQWGFSLFEVEVYGPRIPASQLTPVHFIRLELTDAAGKLLSDNFYWRGTKAGDYTALNTLAPARLQVSHRLVNEGGKRVIKAVIKNTGKVPAVAVHVQAYRTKDGERILPALMDHNYFTLLPKESQSLEISFDARLLEDGDYRLEVLPYNK